MLTQSLAVGQTVAYIRPDRKNAGKVLGGSGIVVGTGLDHAFRPVVKILDKSQPAGDQMFNVDLLAVNPSEEQAAKYADLIRFVAEHGKEGNEAAAKVVNEYNARITAAYNDLVGEPLDASQFTVDDDRGDVIDLNGETANSMAA